MDLIDDCERFVLRSFDGVEQSAMHIYHSALPWTPTHSLTRQLYECELMAETQLGNAVSPTWDTCIRIISAAAGEWVERVVFSPSGALIAAYEGCCAKVFDAVTGANRAIFDGDMSICSVAFSSDDRFLVSGFSGGTISVWDVQTGTMFRSFEWNMRNSVHSVAFSSCGTQIASGNTDRTVRIWNISGGCDYVFQGHFATVTGVCWMTWNQVVSASNDLTVRVWDVRKQTCLKIFAHYHDRVTALAFSRGLLLVASRNGTANIYDSQSGDIIHVIRSSDISDSRFSVDGGKVLVAGWNSGGIWDITDITTKTLTRVRSIDYNGVHAMFSPDGTRVASIYGKFIKIWKTNTGYNHHAAFTHLHDTINDIYISSDERLVALKSKEKLDILDATTGQFLFTHPVVDFISIGFSLDLAIVAFLKSNGTVQISNTPTPPDKSNRTVQRSNPPDKSNRTVQRLNTLNFITVNCDMFHIALSPDGSQLACLSPSHMTLWDLKSKGCLADLEFNKPLQGQFRISFSIDATSVSVLTNTGGAQSWLISPTNREDTKLPMVFVPTMEERSNRDASAPCQSYCCDTDGEWILDQDERRVLWIPPDERPRQMWCFEPENKVLVQTESGKVYIVNFLQS